MKILIVCTDREILDTILRLLTQRQEWRAFGAISAEEALSIFSDEEIDLVLLGSGLDQVSEDNLATTFRQRKPAIKVVQHFGGGSGLLFTEIMQAIERR